MFDIHKTTLKNGLRVITVPMKNTEAVTLLVAVRVGSRNESEKLSGISHFIEHTLFKGSKNRPTTKQIQGELDRVGASYTAFTSKETTGFLTKSSTKDFGNCLSIISDIILNPLFNKTEIERERGVISQEIDMYKDSPRSNVHSVFEEVIYDGQPIGRDIAGTKQTVGNIKRTDLLNFKNKNYLPKNMVVVVTGKLDPKETTEKIEQAFQKIKMGERKADTKTDTKQISPRVELISKELDQSHIVLGTRGYDMFHKDKYVLSLLSIILGGNSSSKLFTEIREKRGLVYYVHGYNEYYTDCGYLGVNMGVPHDKLEEAVNITLKIFKEIKNKGVSKKDLTSAKSFIRGQIALSFETSDSVASHVADQELLGNKILQPEETLKKFEEVTQKDILRVANDIFKPNRMNLAVIGKFDNVSQQKKLYKGIFKGL